MTHPRAVRSMCELQCGQGLYLLVFSEVRKKGGGDGTSGELLRDRKRMKMKDPEIRKADYGQVVLNRNGPPHLSEAVSPSSVAITFIHHCRASSVSLVRGREEILFTPVQEGIWLNTLICTSSDGGNS